MTPRISLVYGAAIFGAVGTNGARLHTIPDCQAMMDFFDSRGHSEYDTSNRYCEGTSEQIISQLDLKGGTVDTKIFPFTPGDHGPGKLRELVNISAGKLAPHKINILYLHAPDRSVPYEDTMREINELYKDGLFKEFGLSNYNSWEVAEIYTVAKAHGWVPSIYQGRYNTMERNPETELIPCLRKYGIKYYVYSPLANGVLGGKFVAPEDFSNPALTSGTRWAKDSPFSAMLIPRYEALLGRIQDLKNTLDKHHIRIPEASFRWLQHHSALLPGDKVVIGASNPAQLEANLADCESGPLPEEVVTLLDGIWANVKGEVSHYAF